LFDATDKGDTLHGEASVMYLYSKAAAKRIHEYNPSAKILIFIRPYVDFLTSYHRQLINILEENESDFRVAWGKQSDRKSGRYIPKDCREPLFLQYREVAAFGAQVDRYHEFFSPAQIKIICFEKWTASPRETYLEIMEFLGLHDDGRDFFEKINPAKQQRTWLLAKLTQRPPRWLLDVLGFLKRFLKKERLGLAGRLRHLNEVETGIAAIPFDLQSEILEAMKADLDRMKEYVAPASLGY
jgi:hypothetical protein